MITNPSLPSDAPEPEPTHWSIGDVPPRPPAGTVVADKDGTPWIRIGETWQRAGLVSLGGGRSWTRLLVENGPLTRLVPADDADTDRIAELERQVRGYDEDRHTERDRADVAERRNAELLAEIDNLRNTVARYRGTPPLRDAAKALVMAATYDPSDKLRADLMDRLRVALNAPEPERRTAAWVRDRHRINVVREARRLLDAYDDDSTIPLVVMDDLRKAVAKLDEHVMSPSGDES